MKILQVNCVYKEGSTGKITYDIHKELIKNNIESIVCYGRKRKIKEKNIYKVCGELYSKVNHFLANLSGIMYGGCFFSTKKLENIILKEKPDIVHLQCINGYFVNIYKFIKWLKENNIKTVLTLHAEFMYTANCGYALECERWKIGCGCCPRLKEETSSLLFDKTATSWKYMKKAFENFDNLIVVSVSPWLMNRAKYSPFFKDKEHKVVLNGLDAEIFKLYDTTNLRRKYAKQEEKIILFVTPEFNLEKNHIKGGYYINKLAKQFLNDSIKFLIIGDYKKNIEVSKNIILLGRILDQKKLACFYSMADITILASKRETFSMVTAESLCCGTPVVGFKAGAPEQIAIKEYSEFVEYGDIDRLEKAVNKFLCSNFNKGTIEKRAKSLYSKENMCLKYIDIYKKILEENI